MTGTSGGPSSTGTCLKGRVRGRRGRSRTRHRTTAARAAADTPATPVPRARTHRPPPPIARGRRGGGGQRCRRRRGRWRRERDGVATLPGGQQPSHVALGEHLAGRSHARRTAARSGSRASRSRARGRPVRSAGQAARAIWRGPRGCCHFRPLGLAGRPTRRSYRSVAVEIAGRPNSNARSGGLALVGGQPHEAPVLPCARGIVSTVGQLPSVTRWPQAPRRART